MSYSVVIPARYGSTRLPAKALQDICGKSLIQRVYERASLSSAQQVIIATDDERIASEARQFGADVELTAMDCVSGTVRVAEVVKRRGWADDHIVVNVQGDEPLIPPAIIDQAQHNLAQRPLAQVATLSAPIAHAHDLFDPNVVKVVCDAEGYALYFSRAPIPWCRDAFALARDRLPTQIEFQRHVGLYAYRCGFLTRYAGSAPCGLENAESLEQLRVLWHGGKIHVATACQAPGIGVDTPEDLAKVRATLAHESNSRLHCGKNKKS
ncbi:MAG: 3-deoxy-manno-octulosonate cytidylyltransferase [Pseudomonadota bacterium]